VSDKDPFAHLHDEGYAAAFASGFVGHRDLVSTAGRPLQNLDGNWHLTLDLFDEGLRQKWYAEDDRPPSQWMVPRDYEVEAGDSVPVPSCWNLLKPEWRYFEGAGWYSREFEYQPHQVDERVFLQVGAAAYCALVFVNGRFAGGHRGASTPFSIEITSQLRPGSNRLQVMVENRRRADRVPMHHFDWFNYGGLYREVGLLRLPRVFIRRMTAKLVSDGTYAKLAVAVQLSDPVDGIATVAIPELGVSAPLAIRGGRGAIEIAARPALWSTQVPKLYDVAVRFGADVASDRIGFREIRVRGTEILLNGRSIFLRGVCVHEDDLLLGKTATVADMRRRIADARELGANFLRLAHYPHHESMARLADEAGLLLWAEVPVYWAIDFANPEAYADAENQLLELIARDGNRASVVIWGVGNENADTDARLSFMSGLARAARRADPTRLVAAACLINRGTFRIEDRLAGELDVVGLNEYFGWYEPLFEGFERLLGNSDPGKPVIVSETGADAASGYRAGGRVLFTEDWQAEFYRRQAAVIERCFYVRGLAAWLLYDFRSERRQTGFQRGFNRKGLIAADKTTRKLAFAALGEIYRRWAATGSG
jgi:beta-glucuronidase